MLVALALVSLSWGANLALPAGERAADWAAALEASGLSVGAGGVEVEGGPVWRLRYVSAAGERSATVPAPRTAEEREQVAIVAASLLRQRRDRSAPSAARVGPERSVPPPPPSPPSASVRRVARIAAAAVPVDPPAPEAPAVVDAVPVDPPAPEVPAVVDAVPVDPPAPEAPAVVVVVAPPASASLEPPRVASPPDSAFAARPRAPRLTVSAAAGAVGLLRPGLGANPGAALSARLSRGPGWLEANGELFAATQFEVGTLGLSTLSLRAGGRVEPSAGWGCFAGAGVVAERWEIVDLAGVRAAAGFGVEGEVGMDRTLWGPVALELALRGGWDAQTLQIDVLPEPPSRFTAGVRLGLRVGT
jgi:hypothetical protein